MNTLRRSPAQGQARRDPCIIEWKGNCAYASPELAKGAIANELVALRRLHRTRKFTQAQIAEIIRATDRIARLERKVREDAPAKLLRLVDAGRISILAVECLLPRLTNEDKQRIEGMSDDDAEAEVMRLRASAAIVARALHRAKIEASTPQRLTFVNAIERLHHNDAGWACEVASHVQRVLVGDVGEDHRTLPR
jgi:hypothetical protein